MSDDAQPLSSAVGYERRTRGQLGFAFAVAVIGLIVGIRLYGALWALDANGFSHLSGKLPYWDFTNLWAGTRMAMTGHVDWLFDAEAYRRALRITFTPLLPDQEWSYPPSILLLGLPLDAMPIFWAYAVWTVGSIAALYVSLGRLRLPILARFLVVLSPAVAISAIFGQNGALTAALMMAALALSADRPIPAGVLAGLLTVKPHLGILIPFAYLASGNWRAFISAALTAMVMVIATAVLFGADVWMQFIGKTAPLMATILEAPYPQPYQANAMTFFIFGRWLGLSVAGAYLVQAAFTALAIGTTIWLWRSRSAATLQTRVVMTALLSISATPYGYVYDAVPYSVAVAWLFLAARSPNRLIFDGLWLCIFGVLWLFPFFADRPNYYGYGVGIIVPAALAVYGIGETLLQRQQAGIKAASAPLSRSGDSRPSAG